MALKILKMRKIYERFYVGRYAGTLGFVSFVSAGAGFFGGASSRQSHPRPLRIVRLSPHEGAAARSVSINRLSDGAQPKIFREICALRTRVTSRLTSLLHVFFLFHGWAQVFWSNLFRFYLILPRRKIFGEKICVFVNNFCNNKNFELKIAENMLN